MTVVIDGSTGEGGGQVLRTSLALAMVTGQSVEIHSVRARRKKPGLRRAHLTALLAARDVCGAEVRGAEVGSREVLFIPGEVSPGDYRFSIGTAGSTTLVAQTLLPALVLAGGLSRLVLEGGTHNPMAPPFDFLARAFLPLLERMGPRVRATLRRPGFHPKGGGEMVLEIEPCERLQGLSLLEPGRVRRRSVRSLLAHLPRHIAERELKLIARRTSWPQECFVVEELPNSRGPGNAVLIELEQENVTEVFTGFGELRVPAEKVARGAVRELQRYRKAGVAVGEHLADQLLLPLALAGSGSFTTLSPSGDQGGRALSLLGNQGGKPPALSGHATTQMELIPRFLDVRFEVEAREGGGVLVGV